MCPAAARVKAYCASESRLTFTTPLATAARSSAGVEPLEPWKSVLEARARVRVRQRALAVAEDLGAQLDVPGGIETVDVAERGRRR